MAHPAESKPIKQEAVMPDKGSRSRLEFLSERFSYHLEPRKADWANMQRDLKMVMGEQWEDGEPEALASKGKGAYNLNLIAPLVDTVGGYERENRREIIGRPRQTDRKFDADVVTEVIRDVDRENDADYIWSEVADDSLVGGEGIIGYLYDFEKQKYIIVAETSFAHVPDRDCLDTAWATCDEHFKFQYMSQGKMKMWWPDKATEIDLLQPSVFSEFDGLIKAAEFHGKKPADRDFKSNEILKAVDITKKEDFRDFYDEKRKRWRVIEAWCKVLVPVDVIMERVGYEERLEEVQETEIGTVPWTIGTEGSEKGELVQHTAKLAPFIADADNYRIKERARRKIFWRLTVFAGDTILSDGLTQYPRLPFVPTYAKFRHDGEKKYFHGVVRPLTDPQKIFNKSMSQQIYVINKAASSVNFVNEDIMESAGGEAAVKEAFTSSFNAMLPVDGELLKNEQLYKRVDPGQVPDSLFLLPGNMKELINDISGMDSLAFLGMEEPGDPSGWAIELRQRQNILRIATAFDNMAKSRRIFYRDLIWPMVKRDRKLQKRIRKDDLTTQDLKEGRFDLPINLPYSELTEEEKAFVAQATGKDPLEIEMLAAEGRLYNDLSTMDIDIVFDDVAMTPTERMRALSVLLKMTETYGPEAVPIDLVLEYTDNAISEKIRAIQKAQAQEPTPVEPPPEGTPQTGAVPPG